MPQRKNSSSKEIQNVFVSVTDKAVARKAETIAAKMDLLVKAAQKTFFTVLAGKLIGAISPPDLGSHTPQWAPLTKKYQDYRLKTRKVARSRFYEYNSRRNPKGKPTLKGLLATAKAETTFGTPVAEKTKTIVSGRSRNSISVKVFPKVKESLVSEQLNEKNYLKARNRGIAWRLRNFQGTRLRPILQPFMLWWMDVKMKQLIREATR